MKIFCFLKRLKYIRKKFFIHCCFIAFIFTYVCFSQEQIERQSGIKDVHTVIRTRRSIRKFKQIEIDLELLKQIVQDGSLAATASNKQPWEFIIVNDKNKREQVFKNIYWLKQASKPSDSQKPTAYIIVLGNPNISKSYIYDCSAAAQNILLSAWGYGIGSCWIGSMNRDKLYKIFNIPKELEIVAIIALGYPDETPSLKKIKKSSTSVTTPYIESNRLVVPKYQLEDILHINEYR